MMYRFARRDAASRAGMPVRRARARRRALLDIWPVERARLQRGIAARLARQRQRVDRGARVPADRVEGNLLAAHQEVRKLSLVAGEGAPLEAVRSG